MPGKFKSIRARGFIFFHGVPKAMRLINAGIAEHNNRILLPALSTSNNDKYVTAAWERKIISEKQSGFL